MYSLEREKKWHRHCIASKSHANKPLSIWYKCAESVKNKYAKTIRNRFIYYFVLVVARYYESLH